MPMRKNSTLNHITQPIDIDKMKTANLLSPSDESISKILRFAASYRVEKTSENHFVEYFLN